MRLVYKKPKFAESKRPNPNIKLDPWDIWNVDYLLATIIVPVLTKLLKDGCGHGCIADEDLPPELAEETKDDKWDVKRWHWALNEMILAFQFTIDCNGSTGMLHVDDKILDRAANGRRLFAVYFNSLWD